MSYIFKDATLLEMNIAKNYSSNNNALISSVKNINLQGILYNRKTNADAIGVKESILDMQEILNSISGQYEAIEVNNYFLGSGIIKSVDFEEDNPVFIGKYKYNIEIFEDNNFEILSGNYYGTGLLSVKDQIKSFDEDFNFKYDSDLYDYTHNLKISLNNSQLNNQDVFDKLKTFASGIFNDNLNYGLYGDFSGYYNNLKTKKNLFSESYNLINGECSFSKNIQINKNFKNDYSISYNHAFNIRNDGIATVSEDSQIYFLNKDAIDFDGIITTEKNSSYIRCSDFFSQNISAYTGDYYNLFNQPLEFGKTFEPQKSQAKYKILYTNDINYKSNYYLEYSINRSTDGIGIITDNEKGTILIYKGSNTNPDVIFSERKNLYPKILQDSFAYESGNFYPLENFQNMNYEYSITSTSDPAYLGPNNKITYLKTKISDKEPTQMIKEYIVVGHGAIKSNGNQRNLGEKNIEVKGVGKNMTFREVRDLLVQSLPPQLFTSVVNDESYSISLNGDFEARRNISYDV